MGLSGILYEILSVKVRSLLSISKKFCPCRRESVGHFCFHQLHQIKQVLIIRYSSSDLSHGALSVEFRSMLSGFKKKFRLLAVTRKNRIRHFFKSLKKFCQVSCSEMFLSSLCLRKVIFT